jgi:hypothetical protein
MACAATDYEMPISSAYELHHANSSSRAFASFKSNVSKPSVNHPWTGARRSRVSGRTAWSVRDAHQDYRARSPDHNARALRRLLR